MARRKILICDDSATFVMLEKTLLLGWDIQVLEARDGLEGVKKVRTEKPDLVFMDVNMPNLTGIEAIRLLRADPESREVPIILVTTLSSMQDVAKGKEAGATDHLTKPVSKDALERMLRKYLA